MNMPVATTIKPIKPIKTRNYHHCCECHVRVRPGNVMMVHRGIWEEGPAAEYWCLGCDLLFRAAKEVLAPGETLCYGELHDFVRNVT